MPSRLRVTQNDDDTDSDIARRGSFSSTGINANVGTLEDSAGTSCPSNSNVAGAEEDEFQDLLARKWKRQGQLIWVNGFFCLCILLSWLMGVLGFSIAWIILLLAVVYLVWEGNIIRLIEETVRYESLRIRVKKALRSEESAEWLNTILNKWWVFSADSISSIVKESLDPILNDCKPAILESVELQHFSLGDRTPYISSIRALDVTLSPSDLLNNKRLPATRHLVIEAGVGLQCDDFHMVLRARVGHKGMGVDMDLVMEKLHINGKMQISLLLNHHSQFPHITKVSVTFVEKPEVWFSVKILKALSMMEVPILKTWVHSLVMDALTTALVDPGKIIINLCPKEAFMPAGQNTTNSFAEGVLTVTVGWAQTSRPSSGGKQDEEKWCVLRVGDSEFLTPKVTSSSRWQECRSFLVESPMEDNLTVKIKTKRIISTMTLAAFNISLAKVCREKIMETVLQKKGIKVSNVPPLFVRMEYSPLPPIHLDSYYSDMRDEPDGAECTDTRAGVLYICVHSADGLGVADGSEKPNPYCIILCNKKKIKTTHYACNTYSPKWESSVEFLVVDYTKSVISFAVCSWDSSKMTESSFLGLATLQLDVNEVAIIKRTISISPIELFDTSDSGTIVVSVIFRPAASVTQSEETPGGVIMESGIPVMLRNNTVVESSLRNTAFFLTGVHDQEPWSMGSEKSSTSGSDYIMEMTLIRAKNLVAKDFNGYSDPYCEVKVNEECKFKTKVRKRTLNPNWDESVTTQLPKKGDQLTLVVWDHDTFSARDFLGSVTLNIEDIRRIAAQEGGEWLQLQNTKSGEIEVNFRILSNELEDIQSLNALPVVPAIPNATVNEVPNHYSNNRPAVGTPSPIIVPKTEHHPPPPKELPPPPPPPPVVPPVVPPVPPPSLLIIQPPHHSNGEMLDATPPAKRTSFDESDQTVKKHGNSFFNHSPHDPSPSISKASSSNASSPTSSTAPSLIKASTPKSGTPAYSSLRKMKSKVKKTFGQPLRRFRSEASVHEDKSTAIRERIHIEQRNDDTFQSCNEIDRIPQEVLARKGSASSAHLNDSTRESAHVNGDGDGPAEEKRRYHNITGRVVQITGLDLKANEKVYCRIRRFSESHDRKNSSGRTVAKSKVLPSNQNIPFNMDFKIDSNSGLLGDTRISFDIRTTAKETVTAKVLTLQELMEADLCEPKPGEQVRTCLSMDSGAVLELVISFGKWTTESSSGQSGVSKLLRSWSVHKIGKI